ncbi:hypothetical protein BH09PAT1_BH09PAT1_5660 [soil metagenome]
MSGCLLIGSSFYELLDNIFLKYVFDRQLYAHYVSMKLPVSLVQLTGRHAQACHFERFSFNTARQTGKENHMFRYFVVFTFAFALMFGGSALAAGSSTPSVSPAVAETVNVTVNQWANFVSAHDTRVFALMSTDAEDYLFGITNQDLLVRLLPDMQQTHIVDVANITVMNGTLTALVSYTGFYPWGGYHTMGFEFNDTGTIITNAHVQAAVFPQGSAVSQISLAFQGGTAALAPTTVQMGDFFVIRVDNRDDTMNHIVALWSGDKAIGVASVDPGTEGDIVLLTIQKGEYQLTYFSGGTRVNSTITVK